MKRQMTQRNRDGQLWSVAYRESEELIQVSGFLVTYGVSSCITLSAGINPAIKRRTRRSLLKHLATLPLGTPGVYLWDDEQKLL
jgi:hypothetical protein